MKGRKKYRLCLLLAIAADLLALGYLGYRYTERKIPDKIQVTEEENTLVKALQSVPWVTLEETIETSGNGKYRIGCQLLGVIPYKEIQVETVERPTVLVSGSPVGLYLETKGVLIVDTSEILSHDGSMQDPAKNIVRPGDYIVAFNDQSITTKNDLVEDVKSCSGESVCLTVNREGEEIPLSVNPVRDQNGDYKLGIWVRDNTQGIGTLTFADENGNFGALGHGISDIDTGDLMEIQGGKLYQAEILNIRKGSRGNPGELAGLIRYETGNQMGSITENTGNGIYGTLNILHDPRLTLTEYPVGFKQELQTGDATILCCVNGAVQEYSARITEIDMNHKDTNKSFIIQITDEDLLNTTGGIVQGMSGSPILQNGYFVGAITHVFVQDSTSGYGIFAENMLLH